jgi:hypothetical protein
MKKWKCKYCNEILIIEKKQNISNHYLRCDDYKKYKDNILTKEFLIEEYVKKEKSAYEISKEINIGVNPILKYIDKFGIKHRSIKEATNLDRCRTKYKKTCMNLYGAENALSKDTIPYKNRNKTVLDRYGVDNVRKHPDIINDIKIKVDKWRKEKDIQRQKEIEEYLGCDFIRLKFND